MKKLLLSLVLILVLCIGMIPPMIFANQSEVDADGNIIINDTIELFMKEPVLNEKVFFNIETKENVNYEAQLLQWDYRAHPNGKEPNDTIREWAHNDEIFMDAMYDCIIHIKPKEGYAFPETLQKKPILHVGDKTYTVENVMLHNMYESAPVVLSYRFAIGNAIAPIMIDDLTLNYQDIVVGEKANFNISIPENANYTAYCKIRDETAFKFLTAEDEIMNEHRYYVMLTCEPKHGYEFPFEGRLNMQTSDSKGEAISIQNAGKDQIIFYKRYDFRNPPFDHCHLTFRRPNVGDKISDTQMPIPIDEEDNDKFEIKNTKIELENKQDIVYEKDKEYIYSCEISPKDGYRLIDRNKFDKFSVVDQYGEYYPCKIHWKQRKVEHKVIDYVLMEINYHVPKTYTVTFRVENGSWKDGTKDDIQVEIPILNHKAILSEEQIPTGMIPDALFQNGNWLEEPNVSDEGINNDQTYIYQFEAKENVATVTLRIENGKWSNTGDVFHSDDIVVYVPLVDGKGTFLSKHMPTYYRRDEGCLFGDWVERIDFTPGGITGDVTYIYHCPRVVNRPLTYTITYDMNDHETKSYVDTKLGSDIELLYFIPEDKVPTRDGYTFVGWNTKADGSGTQYEKDDYFKLKYTDRTETLYAQWEKLPYCSIQFVDHNHPTLLPEPMLVYANENQQYKLTIPDNPVPSLEGYQFLGYQVNYVEDLNHITTLDTYYQPKDSLILSQPGKYELHPVYEVSKEKLITLSYDTTGGSQAPQQQGQISYGEQVEFIISTTIPTKDGYTFKNWKATIDGTELFANPGQVIRLQDNVCFYAQWQKNKSDEVIIDPKQEKPDEPAKPDVPKKPEKQEKIDKPSIKDEIKKIETYVDEHLLDYVIPSIALIAFLIILIALIRRHIKQ